MPHIVDAAERGAKLEVMAPVTLGLVCSRDSSAEVPLKLHVPRKKSGARDDSRRRVTRIIRANLGQMSEVHMHKLKTSTLPAMPTKNRLLEYM
jgi:hypothetical protein